MIETYAFIGMCAVQILAMSVLFPARLMDYVRATAALHAEEIKKIRPEVDTSRATERFAARYRAVNTAIAALGVFALCWLVVNTKQPDAVKLSFIHPSVYFMVQALPFIGLVLKGIKGNRAQASLTKTKRKADLQRRSRFDYISPLRLFIHGSITAVLVSFVLYLMYFAQEPLSMAAGYIAIGAAVATYLFDQFVWDWSLYSKKTAFETDTDRKRWASYFAIKSVHWSLVYAGFILLFVMLEKLSLDSWVPIATSLVFVYAALAWRGQIVMPSKAAAFGESITL